MKTALILNDTAQGDVHIGCKRVMRTLRDALAERGIAVKAAIPVGLDWKLYPGIYEIISEVDLIIVNGEGTLHNGRKKAEELLTIADALNGRKPYLALVNSIYENNPLSWVRYLNKFDLIVTRDSESAKEISELLGRSIKWLPDFSMCTEEFFDIKKTEPKLQYLFSDSVSWSSSKMLFQWACKLRKEGASVEIYPLSPIFKPEIQIRRYFKGWLKHFLTNRWKLSVTNKFGDINYLENDVDYISVLKRSSMHVTGRFHSACLSLIAGTPFVAVSSNTKKIERLISDIGLSASRVLGPQDIEKSQLLIDDVKFSDEELFKIDNYLKEGRKRFRQIFDDLAVALNR